MQAAARGRRRGRGGGRRRSHKLDSSESDAAPASRASLCASRAPHLCSYPPSLRQPPQEPEEAYDQITRLCKSLFKVRRLLAAGAWPRVGQRRLRRSGSAAARRRSRQAARQEGGAAARRRSIKAAQHQGGAAAMPQRRTLCLPSTQSFRLKCKCKQPWQVPIAMVTFVNNGARVAQVAAGNCAGCQPLHTQSHSRFPLRW